MNINELFHFGEMYSKLPLHVRKQLPNLIKQKYDEINPEDTQYYMKLYNFDCELNNCLINMLHFPFELDPWLNASKEQIK